MTRVHFSGFVMIAVCAATLTACVNPSAKIATELTRYGLNARQSQCVGDRLESGLSIGQLQQLGRAAKAYTVNDSTPGRLTVSDLVRVSAQMNDPKVALEVGRAAANCGVLSSLIP